MLLTCDAADKRERYQVRFPGLIAEVLSPGTAEYDRTEKFGCYQKIPTLRHYLLLSQSSWTVEWFRRDEAGQWIYTLLNDPAAFLIIPDLGLHLPLAELYEDTDVAPSRPMPPAPTG
ncbi:MAG: Uma2 family endonuclease [Janthinobacterium lividum]